MTESLDEGMTGMGDPADYDAAARGRHAQGASANYLTTAEVADRYRTKPGTVRYWRHIGYGPKGVRVGRRVLYSADALAKFDAWLAEKAAS